MDAIIAAHPDYEVKLYALSLIKLSIIFWERPEIKADIRKYFSNNDEDSWTPKTFHKITHKVLDLADASDKIAPGIIPELTDAILNTGVKIYDWIWYCFAELGLDVTYSDKIFWTPLGFVDQERIFKSWEMNESLYEGDKLIFRVACMLAQEEFIEKHEEEMIEELKKLPVEARSNFTAYGIISTYLCCYINHDLNKKWKENFYSDETFPSDKSGAYDKYLINEFDEQSILREHLRQTVTGGNLAPPHIMAKLCAFSVLSNAIRYYYKKLESSKEGSVNTWIKNFCHEYSIRKNHNHYRIGKLREIEAFVYSRDFNLLGERSPFDLLLYLCPLENIIWPNFNKWLSLVPCGYILQQFMEWLASVIENDFNSGLHGKRNLLQKLLKKTMIKGVISKINYTRKNTYLDYISICVYVEDFTILKKFLCNSRLDSEFFEKCLQLAYDQVDRRVYFRRLNQKESGFLWKKFFDDMFDSSNDRINFFIEQFSKSGYLIYEPKLNLWEELYYATNILHTPLKESMDPLKCLGFIAKTGEGCMKNFDKFVRWWCESEDDQMSLKNKFKTSFYLPETIYKLWLKEYYYPKLSLVAITDNVLDFFFKSEDDITRFKMERLSVLDLLYASFREVKCGIYFPPNNLFYKIINGFIVYCGISPERIDLLKVEIGNQIEGLILNNSVAGNILTLNFLMDWISLSEKNKKKIFQKLNVSSKIFTLSEDVLKCRDSPALNIFYNNWLKLSGNISEVKMHLISIYEGEREEKFVSRLSLMYDRLERGEYLDKKDIVIDNGVD